MIMKKFTCWMWVGLLGMLLALPTALAQGADQDYIAIYKVIKQADQYRETGLSEQAAESYARAARELKSFQKANPNWNPRVIQFRLKYLTRQMESLPELPTGKPEENVIPDSTATSHQVSGQSPENAATGQIAAHYQGQIQALNLRLEQLKEENQLYMAKLREAMAAQPSGFNAADWDNAEQKIVNLNKERDVLRAQLEAAKQEAGSGQDEALAQWQSQFEQAQSTIQQQENLIESLKQQMLAATEPNTEAAQMARDQLVQDLMEQNALLRRQTESQAAASVATSQPEAYPAPKVTPDSSVRSRWRWWPFRRSVQKKGEDDRWLRAKLAAYEAERVPFRPEELALMESEKPEALVENTAFQPSRSLTASQTAEAARLEREAKEAIASGDLTGASERLSSILTMAPEDPVTLSNLALVEIRMERPDLAEPRLRQAMAIQPGYAYAYFLMGLIQAQAREFERALDFLSKGAELSPEDHEIQNQLGVVLSELGQREAAESALRKAVALEDEFAEAHINLAVIYASQSPAFPELARFHYQRALDAGHAKEPRVERLLEGGQ